MRTSDLQNNLLNRKIKIYHRKMTSTKLSLCDLTSLRQKEWEPGESRLPGRRFQPISFGEGQIIKWSNSINWSDQRSVLIKSQQNRVEIDHKWCLRGLCKTATSKNYPLEWEPKRLRCLKGHHQTPQGQFGHRATNKLPNELNKRWSFPISKRAWERQRRGSQFTKRQYRNSPWRDFVKRRKSTEEGSNWSGVAANSSLRPRKLRTCLESCPILIMRS